MTVGSILKKLPAELVLQIIAKCMHAFLSTLAVFPSIPRAALLVLLL